MSDHFNVVKYLPSQVSTRRLNYLLSLQCNI